MDSNHRGQIPTVRSGIVKVVVVCGLVSLLGGCVSAPSQLDQCNSVARQLSNRSLLAKKIVRVMSEIALQFNGASNNVEGFQAVAQASSIKVRATTAEVEQLRKSIAGLTLKDTGLLNFRDRALASVSQRSSILNQLEAELQRVHHRAAEMRNAAQGSLSMQPLQLIMAKMDDLDVAEKKNVSAFNRYCDARPKTP
jgi:hypothetical protein